MNWLKFNMFGERSFWCYFLGHKFCFIGKYPHIAVCERCELYDPRLKEMLNLEKGEGK